MHAFRNIPVHGSTSLLVRNGHVLAVSRPGRPHDLGLPGGHVEMGEAPITAAIRETKEETGITVVKAHLVFEDIDHVHKEKNDGRIVLCQTFFVDEFYGEPHAVEPATVVAWAPHVRLLDEVCTFHRYNAALFRSLGWAM
jgi:8-oxo-dGTP pyrophosphatase MutT (NUDIX family)